jgi:hypothetical protein
MERGAKKRGENGEAGQGMREFHKKKMPQGVQQGKRSFE